MLNDELAQYGVLFFRDLPIGSVEDFDAFAKAFRYPIEEYVGGGGPRIKLYGNVLTSTESPPEYTIPFHHEMAYLANYPKRLFFGCEIAPQEGGETPVLLSSALFEKIESVLPVFIGTLREKGVRYIREVGSRRALDFNPDYQKSWEHIFGTDDRQEAELLARECGTEIVEWMENDTMKLVSQIFPGFFEDDRTPGKTSWFNSILLLHKAMNPVERGKHWDVVFGDYTPIEDEHVLKVSELMKEFYTALQWEEGDVMIVDNMLAMHSRNSFTPPRSIWATMYS